MSGNAGPKKNFWVQAWSAMNGMIQFGALSPRDDVTSSVCLLYTSPSPRDLSTSRMPSSA